MPLGYLVGRRFVGRLRRRVASTQLAAATSGRIAQSGWGAARPEFPSLPLAGEGQGEGYSQPAPASIKAASRGRHPAVSRTRERANSRESLEERAQAVVDELLDASGTISPEIEKTSSAFCTGFLAGVFDEAGTFDASSRRSRITLTLADGEARSAVQRMLLRLGIVSEIDQGIDQGDLAIAGPSALRFAGAVIAPSVNTIGDATKRDQLSSALAGLYSGGERFCAEIVAVEPDGEAAVFDVQIPVVNAFDANGLYVHNCGEQPLPPYGACLLGSINLASLVREPFEVTAHLDLEELSRIVPLAVRMMDNVVDASRFPLEAQTQEAKAKRRIGLGVTGLADALILCGKRYGSAEGVALTESWMKAIRREAYLASAQLAAEKGPFPLFDRDEYIAGESVKELDEDVRAAIAAHGIRNALLTSIAPTGTISIFADNVSSGLEPVFSFRYTRNVLMPDGSRKEEEVSDYALRLFHRLKGETAKLPDYFVDAQSLAPGDHLVMQAAVQKYIDSSISKTINLPADIAFESFKDVYLQAYELGCKGCTTYRPNEITGAVLEARKEGERPSQPASGQGPALAVVATPAREPELPLPPPVPKYADSYEAGSVVYMTQPLSRPESLPGQTYKIKWPDGDHAIYITVNDVVQDGRRRPFEIFINTKNMEHYAWTVGLTRMISAVFRRGGDVSFVVEELKAVFDPRGGAWMGGKYVPSLLAAIGDVLERHMIDIGFMPGRGEPAKALAARQVVNLPSGAGGTGLGRVSQCPKCGEAALIRIEGCDQCTSCGYSKCG
jgi:ribonucleoside-diphosphate reductase alpha chain